MARQDPGDGSPGEDRNFPHPRHVEANATAMEWLPVRMDEELLPIRLFYEDVAMGANRQGGQINAKKKTLKKSLKQLPINPATMEDIAQNRPTCRRSVKTGAAIYEANRIAATTAKGRLASHKHRVSTTQCSSPANVHKLSTHIPRANQPGRTSTNSMQYQSHNINSFHTCLRPLDYNHPNH
ncbi:unnamed protein product [Schistocephalus solidus]|uniref:Uncharacterized protein n=1 Tax=Schistocephalus solidus TaxID=70667 RepID=A0A183T5K5_SCHSO|nr:unnamed protein product [Schistocephalus solidus]